MDRFQTIATRCLFTLHEIHISGVVSAVQSEVMLDNGLVFIACKDPLRMEMVSKPSGSRSFGNLMLFASHLDI